jgi:predicted nucleic acid-binding protein
MYLLDTNVVSELRRARPHGAVIEWLRSVPGDQLYISAVTFGELQAGAEKVRRHDTVKAQTIEAWIASVESTWTAIPVDVPIYRLWAKLMQGRSDTWTEDALIGATALIRDFTVATRDVRDFDALGVRTFNPFVDRR